MGINKLIILISAFVFINSCRKPCSEPNYSFSIKGYFTPEKDSVRVGDTLYFISETPTELKDVNTNIEVKYSEAVNLGSGIIITDISKWYNGENGAVDSFSFFNLIGNAYTDPNWAAHDTKQLRFEEANEKYQLKIGIVAQKPGAYAFFVGDAVNVYRRGKPYCGIAKFEILNSNTNQHLYIFENLLNGEMSDYDKKHTYCIKVVE